MSDKGIIFTGHSITAILSGDKTQTRRVIKPQPDDNVIELIPRTTYAGNVLWNNVLGTGKYVEIDDRKCPYGAPGDTLYVKETWAVLGLDSPARSCMVAYRAEGEFSPETLGYRKRVPESTWPKAVRLLARRWRSPLFMPRWAARIWLELTSVKVERLQSISINDVLAEGIQADMSDSQYWRENTGSRFVEHWDAINLRRGFGWDINPWVWVLAFRRVMP